MQKFALYERRTRRSANAAGPKKGNGGSPTVSNAIDLIDSTDVDAQLQRDLCRDGGGVGRGLRGLRRCGICHNIGHNSRTCQIARSETSKSDSE